MSGPVPVIDKTTGKVYVSILDASIELDAMHEDLKRHIISGTEYNGHQLEFADLGDPETARLFVKRRQERQEAKANQLYGPKCSHGFYEIEKSGILGKVPVPGGIAELIEDARDGSQHPIKLMTSQGNIVYAKRGALKKIDYKPDAKWPDMYSLGYKRKPSVVAHNQPVPVRCIENGQIYHSMTLAGKANGVSSCSISKACYFGRKSAGYHWEIVK